MLTHFQIWHGIDGLASRHGLSPSGLARLAGLDPTTFNKSKRCTADGRLRWPSTESLAKVLTATATSLDGFVALVSGGQQQRPARMVPLIGWAQAGRDGYFDDSGFPTGHGWEEIAFPDLSDPRAYALEIAGDSMLPLFRDGDRILVSPAANFRRGDRVVVKTLSGEVMAKQLSRLTAQRIELKSLSPAYEDRVFAINDIGFVHRIIWTSC
jgi:phage repressor protein C with HTH and peptisase S24 domain